MLKGNLCPDGALLKVAGLKRLDFEGPARVFECEEDCARAVETRAYQAGEVLIIRNEGPVGGPGMREMLGVTALIYGQQMGEQVALVTERAVFRARRAGDLRRVCGAQGRLSAARRLWCKTAIAYRIDAVARRMDLLISDAELAARRAAWKPAPPRHKAGLLAKYARQVGQADKGAVTHDGGAEWRVV